MPRRTRVLIVEDNDDLRRSVAAQIELHEQMEALGVGNGAEALQAIESKRFDLILLDVGLPDMDGRELCRHMRRGGVKSPIIMLTAADTDADTILGLEAGANDYVTKPFRLAVLFARIRAHLRQHERSENAVFAIGPYTFRVGANMLRHQSTDRPIRLTGKEAAILKYLLRAGGRAVGREVLLKDIWGYSPAIATHTLESHIYRLRQKIEPDPSRPEFLVSDSRGYRLTA